MKKTVLFLLCSINLFAYRVENTKDREITIYPNKVVVNESLQLKDDGENNRITYEGVSKNIDISSINLIGGDLRGVELEKNADSNSILKSYLGKIIQAEKDGRTYELVLLDYGENLVGKDTKTGEIYILNNPDLKLSNAHIKIENKLVMDVGKLDKKINISYITRGLNLNISHRLDIDKMNLETWGKIYNNMGKDLKDTEVKIISELSTSRAYGMKSAMADSISIDESNDKIEYKLKDKLDLKKNSEKNIKLETKKVSLAEKYVYWTREYSKNPTRIVEIKNIGKTTIPGGRIYVWDDKKYVGDSNVGFIPGGEKYDLKLNKSFNVVVEKKIKSSHSLGNNLIKKEIEIEIRNTGKEKIDLEINYDQLPEVWTKLRSQEKYEKISNRIVRFKLDVDKNSKKKIIFSYIEEKK
ncbi:hypothetical protein [Psychrilyobacter atlanticus]|uniref:hypothetical protein n=1 Tax=Psychrilyobacter atlanticus TaxID=271091 RepID=UPI0004196D0D|nr:hypothetical protein [Psychrilyobacter atlanticus]